MYKKRKTESFSQERKDFYNRLPVTNLDRLFAGDGIPGLLIQDGEIFGMEADRDTGRVVKMAVMVFLILFLLAGSVLISRAEDREVENWKEYMEELCRERNICPELVEAVIEQESNWNPEAVNGDCIGLMQISQVSQWSRMQKLGVADLKDPYENILVGVDLLEELYQRYEDNAAVLMYYNAGYSDRYGLGAYQGDGISDYAQEVLARAVELEKIHGK